MGSGNFTNHLVNKTSFRKGDLRLVGKKHPRERILRMTAAHNYAPKKVVFCGECGKELGVTKTKFEAQKNFYCCKEHWLRNIYTAPNSYGYTFPNSLRRKVRERDDYTCALCKCVNVAGEKNFDVHHIDYNKRNADMLNLITLCPACHRRTKDNRDSWKKIFQAIMIEREIKQINKEA